MEEKSTKLLETGNFLKALFALRYSNFCCNDFGSFMESKVKKVLQFTGLLVLTFKYYLKSNFLVNSCSFTSLILTINAWLFECKPEICISF